MYSTGSKTYLPRRLRAIFHNASVYIYSLRVVSRRPAIKIKTTEQPPPSFSLFFSSLLVLLFSPPSFSFMRCFHRFDSSIESLHVCKSARSIVTLDEFTLFFFYPRHGNGKYYLEKGGGYGSGYVDPSQFFRGRIIYLRFSLRKLLTLLLREASLGDTI